MDNKSKPIIIFTSTNSLIEARKLARILVEKKIVACAQISEIESYYFWERKVLNEPEFRILFKTTKNKYKDVEKVLHKLHSYELPVIYSLNIDDIYNPFSKWIFDNSAGI